MDSQLIDAAVTELLDATEALVEAHKSFAKRQGSNASGVSASLVQRQQDSFFRISTLFDELQVRSRSSGVDASAAAATAWIQPFANKSNILTRIKRLLGHAKSNANIIMNSEASRGAAACAAQLVPLCAQPALALLDQLLTVATTLASSGSAGQLRLVQQVHSLVLHGGAAAEVASTLRATDAYAAFTASPQGQQILARAGLDAFCLNTRATAGCSQGPSAGARLALLAVEGFLGQEEGAAAWVSGKRTCDAEADMREFCASGMLPAVAAAIVDFPILEASVCDGALHGLHYAARDATRAVWYVHMVYNRLVKSMRSSSFLASAMSSGSAGAAILGRAELAASLAQVLTHPDVRRLQEATLERLLLHAGMADTSGRLSGNSGGVGSGSGSRSAGWWLLREEAARRRLVVMEPPAAPGGTKRDTEEWLELEHVYIVGASLCVWRDSSLYESVAGDQPTVLDCRSCPSAAAGSRTASGESGEDSRPTIPLPLPARYVAAYAARTAEASFRLYRGQGLHGAYAPAPTWQLAATQATYHWSDFDIEQQVLPPMEVRKCLPFWVEAAAWALALAVDAEAATRGSGPQWDALQGMARRNAQTKWLVDALETLIRLTAACGTRLPTDEGRADVDRRLHRAGLAATLDHVLRLTFTALDAGTAAAGILSGAPMRVGALLFTKEGLLLRPVGSAPAPRPPPPRWVRPSQAQQRRQGASSKDGSGPGGGGGGADGGHDEPGLIVTAAKRCRLMAARLEAALEANAGRSAAQRRQYRELLVSAAAVQGALNQALNDTKEIASRLEVARQRAAGAAGQGDSGGASDPWVADADARCVSEAHEAFALGARAACPLAALLAQAAAREAAARLEGCDTSLLNSLGDQVTDTVGQLITWVRPLVALPAAQLLACQPHRLLSTSLALYVAMEEGRAPPVEFAPELAQALVEVLVAMAARPHVSTHVRDWLAPPPLPLRGSEQQEGSSGLDSSRAGGSAAAGQGTPPSARGCLAGPLRAALPVLHAQEPLHAALALKLLEAAAGNGRNGGGDGDGRSGNGDVTAVAAAADDAFQRVAAVLAGPLFGLNPPEAALFPDGSSLMALLADVSSRLPGPSTATAAQPPPLPPPLDFGLGPAAALSRVRLCGNPACANFEGAAEGDLELKLCSGCRAVRYCGAECQRAHWRGAHRSECARLAGK